MEERIWLCGYCGREYKEEQKIAAHLDHAHTNEDWMKPVWPIEGKS